MPFVCLDYSGFQLYSINMLKFAHFFVHSIVQVAKYHYLPINSYLLIASYLLDICLLCHPHQFSQTIIVIGIILVIDDVRIVCPPHCLGRPKRTFFGCGFDHSPALPVLKCLFKTQNFSQHTIAGANGSGRKRSQVILLELGEIHPFW